MQQQGIIYEAQNDSSPDGKLAVSWTSQLPETNFCCLQITKA
jgi:hypothetical protein